MRQLDSQDHKITLSRLAKLQAIHLWPVDWQPDQSASLGDTHKTTMGTTDVVRTTLKAFLDGKDFFALLATGFDMSWIYHLPNVVI